MKALHGPARAGVFYLNSQQKGERQSGLPCSRSSSNPADTDLVTETGPTGGTGRAAASPAAHLWTYVLTNCGAS